MPDVTELKGHAVALRLHLDAVLEELRFYVANNGNEQLKPFVEDQVREFETVWAAFKEALAEV